MLCVELLVKHTLIELVGNMAKKYRNRFPIAVLLTTMFDSH